MSERRGTKGLELWCKKMTDGYPGVKIDNMTTSWRDGLAFCAIIHHFRPDLIDFSKLNKEDVYYNNDLAFRVAKQYLGIPALLEPEDMVEYAVPDRLSILTYLSQFYQAFAVTQGSGARIAPKRPTQTSPDHGIVSPASTSPPTKMAHIGVGRVRREPCAKCNLPVFIAERLNIGKLLYHRTCFRCARCDSQLTPANYYETENNGFCCEICPDEEKAMTEGSKEKLLQRSLSDEDKSAGLKTFSNDPDDYSAVFETALESTNSEGGEYFQARSKFFRSQLDSPADSGNEEEPPGVPDTDPPNVPDMDPPDVPETDPSNLSCAKVDSGFPSVNSIVKLSVDVTKDKSSFETKSDTSLVRARMRLFESNDKPSKSDFHRVSQNREAKVTVPIAKLDELENFDDYTKGKLTSLDDNRFDNKKNVKDSAGELVLQTTEDKSDNVSTIEDCKEVKIVDAPIVLPQSEESALTDDDKNIRIAIEKEEAIQHIAVTNFHNKEMEIESHLAIKGAICAENNVDIEDDIAQHYNESVIVLDNVANVEVSVESVKPQEDSIITNDDSTFSTASIRDISQHSEPEENNIIIIEDSPVSTVSTRKKSQVTEENNIIVIEDSPTSTTSEREISQLSESILDSSCNTPERNYPDDLNPFGDDSEDESASNKNTSTCGVSANIKPKPSPRFRRKLVACEFSPVIKSVQLPSANPFERVYAVTCASEDGPITGTRISYNPFESEEDDSAVKPPQPAARRKKVEVVPRISLNPFGSDDEDDQKNKMPMPTPRLSRVATGVDDKEIGYGTLSLSSRLNYGSNSSISSGSGFGSTRKKKPAPRPPISLRTEDSGPNSLASSPSHSVQQSPRVTPKHRKTRKAPPPPTTIFSSTPVSSTKSSDAPNSDSLFRSTMQIPSIPTIPSYPVNNENIELRIHGDDIGKEKNEKDEENRNMQNQDNIHIQISEFPANQADLPVPNKSTYGRWKRKKGQAPSLPIPEKRTIKCLPMSEIKRELDMIEMQQQGLERQGVRLETIIREKCEGEDAEANTDDIAIDVEDLILQLFELVNEKNELFRKQTELMYLRRQQRLEEEHADVEYQIRKLMLLPEANRTDMDKEREEELIKRLVDIVERRNEIVECLEMDRVREAEEDDSISCHINLFTSKREEEKTDTSVSRKENEKDKKKHKKEKKSKHKCKDKLDIEKDIDESEMAFTTLEKKKKKFKLNLF